MARIKVFQAKSFSSRCRQILNKQNTLYMVNTIPINWNSGISFSIILNRYQQMIPLFLKQNINPRTHHLLCICVTKGYNPHQYFCSSKEVSSDEVSSNACDS
jgi:hypothetical protein